MKIFEIQNKGKGVISTLEPSDLLLINPPTYFTDTTTILVGGNGTYEIPYFLTVATLSPEELNPQVVVSGSGTLDNTFNNKTLFINNGAFPMTIEVPLTLVNNFSCGFIHEGTGDVTFVAGAGVTLYNPIGLKSKGRGYNTYIERKQNTSTFYLLGNTKT